MLSRTAETKANQFIANISIGEPLSSWRALISIAIHTINFDVIYNKLVSCAYILVQGSICPPLSGQFRLNHQLSLSKFREYMRQISENQEIDPPPPTFSRRYQMYLRNLASAFYNRFVWRFKSVSSSKAKFQTPSVESTT